MTVADSLVSSRRCYAMPYPDQATRSLPGPATSSEWEGRLETLPRLRVTEVRAMERLRTIHDYAVLGIPDIDAALTGTDQACTAESRP